MRLADKIAALQDNDPYYTFEFFPPRTDQGFENLLARITRLSKLRPIAINITWGAGGSTRARSLELAGASLSQFGLDAIMHFTCTNMEKGLVDDALNEARRRGIQNILALRGDPPRGAEYWIPTDSRFTHAEDLVSYIRSHDEHAKYFCIGVAGYPDGHPDRLIAKEEEIRHLKAKVDAGADFITTQLFYDVKNFLGWVNSVRENGITVPIIPSIMPIQSYTSFTRLTKLCGCKVPSDVLAALEPIKMDDQKVKEFGISLSTRMISDIMRRSDIRGFHFCTLNLERSVQKVLQNLRWAAPPLSNVNKVISEEITIPDGSKEPKNISSVKISTTAASHSATATLAVTSTPASTTTGQAGKGELNNASTWDEFPNGRFGDSKSPAYGGGIDLWTPDLAWKQKKSSSQWASPRSQENVTAIFSQFLTAHGREPAISFSSPFTTGELSAETLSILPQLLKLTTKGWWTVGSQPAADGLPSTDEVIGWGPAGGWIFQKAFVEVFVGEDTITAIEGLAKYIGKGQVTFFAADCENGFRTNMGAEGRNAVTWGAFPGHEIEQSTIIEKESFMAWKEEAFDMWKQWALAFAPDSPERACLEGIRNNRWLLSIVHHDYKDPDALWTFLDSNLV